MRARTPLFAAAIAIACSDYSIKNTPDAGGGDSAAPERPDDAEGAPEIDASPLLIDYGLVDVGASVSEIVTVSNLGDADLTVSGIELTEGGDLGFAVTAAAPLPWTLAPGDAAELTATFTPADTAQVSGLLRIDSDDSDEPETWVELSNQVWLECDDTYSETMPWKRSELWYGDQSGPADSAGQSWYEVGFDDGDWEILAGLPDERGDTADHDVFYRATFQLDAVVGATEIEFVGNDGVWLYVNGSYVGEWGGGWRGDGCVNVESGCGVNYDVDPIDITSLLQVGENVIAVMLTNGSTGYYLEINATCSE